MKRGDNSSNSNKFQFRAVAMPVHTKHHLNHPPILNSPAPPWHANCNFYHCSVFSVCVIRTLQLQLHIFNNDKKNVHYNYLFSTKPSVLEPASKFFAIIRTPNMAFFQRFNSFIEFINGFCFCNSQKVHQNSFFVWSDIIDGFGQPTIPSLFAMEVTQKNFAV